MSEILSEVDGAILTLTFNRPEKQNALTREMYQVMADAINGADGDSSVRVVLIVSNSANFTAGNDIFDFLNDPPQAEGSPVSNFLAAIHNLQKPLLAAVSGNAIGIGTTMLMHCDVVVAAPGTRFMMPFVTLGLVPEAGSSLLFPRLVGHQNAARIFLTGEPFDSARALDFGLIAEISDDPVASIREVAHQISQQPPTAVVRTKALLKSDLHEKLKAVMRAEGELFHLALQSDEAREAFMNFLAKRGK